MATLEERVAYLEGSVAEQTRWAGELRDLVFRVDRRIDALDQKMDGRLDRLDEKVSRQFLWLLGVQVAVLLAVIGALVGG